MNQPGPYFKKKKKTISSTFYFACHCIFDQRKVLKYGIHFSFSCNECDALRR